jgi:26S proteasome regulatory subunit N2
MTQDVQSHGNEGYSNMLITRITNSLAPPEWKEKLTKILSGKFRQTVENEFLRQNNNTDKRLIKILAKKWSSKDSVSNNAMAGLFSIMLLGTNDNSLFSEYHKELGNVKFWAQFTFAASQGLIFPGISNLRQKIDEIKLKSDSGYAKGGELFGRGLANFGENVSEGELEQLIQVIDHFEIQTTGNEDVTSNAHHIKEAELHGQLFHVGLRYAFSGNQALTESIRGKIYQERATQGEAAGYALGLVQAGHLNVDLIEDLVNCARNNPHDRIARPAMFAVALMAMQQENKIDGIYERLIQERDPIVRMGATGLLAMGYVGTSDNKAISKLLNIAATDLSKDVRRLAVIGLAFVLLKKPKSALKLLTMLSTSYNPMVRHAVALSLGILGANSFDTGFFALIEKLIEDKVDYVRQAAGISLGLVSQLATKHLNPKLEEHRSLLQSKLTKKGETSIARMGYILGLSLMGAGGGNCCLQMLTESGDIQLKSVIGVFLFTQYWYWFPTFLGIGLALQPTYLIGSLKDLRIPTGFEFQVNSPKSNFDYYKTKEEEKDKKKKTGPVILSMTKRAKARINKKKQQIEEEKPQEEEEQKKEEVEEPKVHRLANPSRVLRNQVRCLEYLKDQRYQVVLPSRKLGIVFLKDLRPEEDEKFTEDQPKESWMIPPPDFVFKE